MTDRREINYRRPTMPPPAAPAAGGGFCIEFAPEWAGYVMAALDILAYPGLWEGSQEDKDAATDSVAWIMGSLRECCQDSPPPPPPPQPPPPPPPPPGSWAISETGALGYTIEELEEMVTMQIKGFYDNRGVLWLSLDCCNFTPVAGSPPDGWEAPSIFNLEALSQRPPALQAIPTGSDMLAPNSPYVDDPTIVSYGGFGRDRLPVPPQGSSNLTQCVKATAIVNSYVYTMREMTEKASAIKDALGWGAAVVAAGSPVVASIVGTGATGFLTSWIAPALALSALTYEALETFNDNFMTEVNRKAWICALTSKMATLEDFTNGDVTTALQYMALVAGETYVQVHNKVVPFFDIGAGVRHARELAQDGRCDCFTVTNPGQLPPLAATCVRWVQRGFANVKTSDGGDPQTPTSDADAMLPALGSKIAAGTYRSIYTNTRFGEQYVKLGVYFETDKPSKILRVKANIANSGAAMAGNNMALYFYDDATQQWVFTTMPDFVLGQAYDKTVGAMNIYSQRFIIGLVTSGVANAGTPVITMSNILLQIETAAGNFVDVADSIQACN